MSDDLYCAFICVLVGGIAGWVAWRFAPLPLPEEKEDRGFEVLPPRPEAHPESEDR